MNRIYLTSVFLHLFLIVISQNLFSQELSKTENELYNLLMEYRKQNNLPIIPLSQSLTFVAQTHAKDLQEYNPEGRCNMHSWSDKGNWTPCCYTDDHAKAKCMWDKPRELTSYQGNGYEISFWTGGEVNAFGALQSWKNSKGHNSVIINQGIWNIKWNAIGIGISDNYAVVWFGEELDDQPNATSNNP